jgi:hypothetical protein
VTAAHSPASEGWEWTLIQSLPCPQCGHHPVGASPSALGPMAIECASAWSAFLLGADDASLRGHPAPDVWSPIQYAAHSRDMLRVFGDRILLAVAEDDPVVPWFDPGPEGWSAYDRLGAAGVAADIRAEASRFASVLADLVDGAWSRPARRDGVDRFTVAGLACFAVHEAHHHLLDANGTL